MRVVATKDFKTYYRMVSVQVTEGQEFEGPFAEFLVNGRCPVDVIAADNASERSDGDGGLDIDGTAAQILDWVGDDPERARAALNAENEKDKPRSTLVKKLEELAGGE
jgi:hypothetical protein